MTLTDHQLGQKLAVQCTVNYFGSTIRLTFRMCACSLDAPYVKAPRFKFFPPLATFDPPYPLAPDGYLPNSVLLTALRKSAADQALALDWTPPSVSDKLSRLLQEIEEVSKIISRLYIGLHAIVCAFNYCAHFDSCLFLQPWNY